MTELRVERIIPATPERVWRAFTSAAELAAWMWPERWETVSEVDLRVGGRFRIASAVSGMAVVGEYLSLDEPHGLVQTWQWEGEPTETLVTITLDAVPGGTALTIVHENFHTNEDSANHLQGWNDCLDRLEPYLAG